MSFIAKLEVDGTEYKILDCNFGFSQKKGTNLKPSGKPQGGEIDLSIELAKNVDLVDWMVSPKITKSGTVTFYNRDSMSKQITLTFENAFCTELMASYQAHSNQPLSLSLTITAQVLKINDVEHKNNW